MKLTVGMPTFDDFDGVFFSIQSLRMFHPEVLNDVEFLVVDNNPNSSHGKTVKNLLEGWVPNGRYVPYGETTGAANSKNIVFEEAKGEYVICMDCHVMLEAGALSKFIKFMDLHGEDHLYQGPMYLDNLTQCITHMEPVWRGEMHGIWAKAVSPDALPEKPFEISQHGGGLLACRKSAWLGFNKDFRGFGGEEGYIHQKYRQLGKTTLCLPFLKWLHRFGRPSGVKYPLNRYNKIRNYIIGRLELQCDYDDVIEHFKESSPEAELDKAVYDAETIFNLH